MFTANAVANDWTTAYSNEIPYLGSAFFAPRKKTGLTVSWLKGTKGLPVAINLSSFDAKPTFRDRAGVSRSETELAFFRESMIVKEKDIQDLMEVQNRDANDPFVQDVLNRIFDDAGTLRDGAMVVPEIMAFSLLAPVDGSPIINLTGKDGASYTMNYDADGTWKAKHYTALTGTNLWSDTANSKPLSDIRTIKRNALKENGTVLSTAIMSQATFDNLPENAQIKSAILAQNATANIFMDDNLLAQFLRIKCGIDIIVYDKMYKGIDGTAHPFMPDGYVTFLPAGGSVGTMWYGMTPEERSARQAGNQLAIFNTGITITVSTTKEAPYQTITTASEILAPSYERMDEVYVAKVA
ncbi:MAG: phage capsid protein [Ruminococcaceae bacterium]|nr:phage capsid protein [Oscillospiraceae bacterium]